MDLSKVFIKRDTDGDNQQLFGRLNIEGNTFVCDTLERPDYGNQQMVSCIPKGEYLCKWSHMERVNKDHYELQNVPGRTGIFIHSANKVSEIHGCIALGKRPKDNELNSLDFLEGSGYAVKVFEGILEHKDFLLIIT